ncbi:hypothetical protein LTR86_009517 [Recurvomyces mirabilis]|nr:hypothetical protein LTR86_009517 [Recurvomyces mirabilis]
MDVQQKQITSRSKKGFLDLPAELRETIYELLVLKPHNTITMLTNHDCFRSEISASQPAIAKVNQQLRNEALATFYSNNIFLAEVSDKEDLLIAKRWLRSIGDINVGRLRFLAICGWTKVPFGHMLSRRWVKIMLDLREGFLSVQNNAVEADQHPRILKSVTRLREAFAELVQAREDQRFTAQDLSQFMHGFHELCIAY